jgi:NlpC/P60 family putative phage cell wall peptidase
MTEIQHQIRAESVVVEARSWVGTPYHDHAALKGVGCDCLGLMVGLYRNLIGPLPIEIPPYRGDWADAQTGDLLIEAGRKLFTTRKSSDSYQAADILVFRLRPDLAAKHLALVSGPDTMIHAYERAGVVEATLAPWWRRRIAATFQFTTPLHPRQGI